MQSEKGRDEICSGFLRNELLPEPGQVASTVCEAQRQSEVATKEARFYCRLRRPACSGTASVRRRYETIGETAVSRDKYELPLDRSIDILWCAAGCDVHSD